MAGAVVSNSETTGGCQWRTSIVPVTAAENPQEQDALMLLADYASSLQNQNVALAILANSLDLDDFLSGTPQQAAEEVLNLLEPLPDRD